MLHQKDNTTFNRLHEKSAPTMGRKENERALFPTVQVRNFKNKNILSKVEREEEMAYVSVELLNETPLQNSTASIGDMPNVEVEENEINIGTVEHEMRQEGELGMENEIVCVTEAIVNVEGIDIATRKEGVRHVNAEKGLVLKRLR